MRVVDAELSGECGADPVGVAQPGELRWPDHVGRRDAPQHGVDEPGNVFAGQLYGLTDGRVRRDTGELELVGAEPEQRASGRVRR